MKVVINGNQYNIKSKLIEWSDKPAMMHVVEQNKSIPTEVLNPHLNNEQYKLIVSQFSSELKNIFERINTEIEIIDKDDVQFVQLRKSLKFMTIMMQEIVGIFSFDSSNLVEEEKIDFNIKNLFSEVKEIMKTKFEEKKINVDILISRELENVNVSAEKSTVKQILLNLLANIILKTKGGKISINCCLGEDDHSLIKI